MNITRLFALLLFTLSTTIVFGITLKSGALYDNHDQDFTVHLPFVVHHPFALAVTPFAEGIGNSAVVTAIVDPGDGRLFVALQDGRILVVSYEGQIEADPLLDVRYQVNDELFELGLLGLATHPNFAQNGYLYVFFTRNIDSKLVSDLARFTVDSSGIANPNSEQTILRLRQPGSTHKAGALQFGPQDGYLYIATGDGGTPRDSAGHAQSGKSLLGKILRIDIDHGSPYAIPQDNPYVDNSDVYDEIWALGLRNPWRFSFDRHTGHMYIGEVGEGTWEEINFLPSGSGGGQNYGWPCYDGSDEFEMEGCGSLDQYTGPIFAYAHQQDTYHCSVIGGFVYRGAILPELVGRYLFADFCANTLWTLTPDDASNWTARKWGDYTHYWTTFGERSDGELFLGAAGNNTIYQIVRHDYVLK